MADIPLPPVMADVIESPCIQVCTIDKATRTCTGCKRTLDEIARWAGMSADARRRIMLDLKNRS